MSRPRKITQASPRHYSAWYVLGPTDYDTCCDCGLTHKNQYNITVDEKRKQVTLYMRTRRAVGRTRQRRASKEYAR